MLIFGCLDEQRWYLVVEQNVGGCSLVDHAHRFEEIWHLTAKSLRFDNAATVSKPWDELATPLPDLEVACGAYAFTYAQHRQETGINHRIRFQKCGTAMSIGTIS